MPLDDAALRKLGTDFQNVAFRANRLREWMELESHLRALEGRFDPFYLDVQRIEAATYLLDRIPTFRDSWRRCQDTEITDLQAFLPSVQYVNQTLPRDGDDGGGRQVDISLRIQSLIQSGDQIQNALSDVTFRQLQQSCADFRRGLKALLADRRNMVNGEVRQLCELTARVRERLGA